MDEALLRAAHRRLRRGAVRDHHPLWVGGTLCFLASSAFSEYFIHLGGPKIRFLGDIPIADLLFKVGFIWFSIVVAIAALERGKWIPNFGAVCRAFVLLFFSFTVLIYAFKHGINGFGFRDFIPGATSTSGTLVFLGVVPLLLFNYVGFELANGAAEEMVDPQKDVPKSVIRSAIATVILYSLPTSASSSCCPPTRSRASTASSERSTRSSAMSTAEPPTHS